MALLLPGLLLIRAALSQQPSNNSLTFRLKRSCQVSSWHMVRLASGPSKMPSEKNLDFRGPAANKYQIGSSFCIRAAGHVFDT
jgi:hypothetical protein